MRHTTIDNLLATLAEIERIKALEAEVERLKAQIERMALAWNQDIPTP